MSERLDFDRPYEEVYGHFAAYRYTQDGKHFNGKGVRVNADGSLHTVREAEKEAASAALAANPALQGAAKAAAKGVQLPARVVNQAKGKGK